VKPKEGLEPVLKYNSILNLWFTSQITTQTRQNVLLSNKEILDLSVSPETNQKKLH